MKPLLFYSQSSLFRICSASEVLSDATLTVSYTFANDLLDSGPLGINGTGTDFQFTNSGRIDQALDLLMNPSYIQAAGLVYLGTDGYPYSMATWIKPTMTTNGTIIHVSSGTSGVSWSMPMLGFTSAGKVGVQACTTSGAVSITGPVVTIGVWTHLTVTYSQSNKLRLWVNGTQSGISSTTFNSSSINAPVTITLGTSTSSVGVCSASVISMGQYSGSIDEFRLFSRELSSSDIASLANP